MKWMESRHLVFNTSTSVFLSNATLLCDSVSVWEGSVCIQVSPQSNVTVRTWGFQVAVWLIAEWIFAKTFKNHKSQT